MNNVLNLTKPEIQSNIENINRKTLINKKRKNDGENSEIYTNKAKKPPKMSNNRKKEYTKIIFETKLDIYVRVLLDAYRTIPNVVKILDSIIEKRASTISPIGPTGFSYNAFDEVEKVIHLTERKDKLINLYLISKKMLDSLTPEDRKFALKKFIQKRNSDDLAIELNINRRTIFRKTNSVITKLCYYLISQNWTSDFIELQIGDDEPWLKDILKRKVSEYKANIKRKDNYLTKQNNL